MEIMTIFIFNMKKYRKKKRISQMKLAEMIGTSTSYIGEIEINSRVPSLAMVEKIAKALGIEPFRLFLENEVLTGRKSQISDDYLECLSSKERQDIANKLKEHISTEVDKILQPETIEE